MLFRAIPSLNILTSIIEFYTIFRNIFCCASRCCSTSCGWSCCSCCGRRCRCCGGGVGRLMSIAFSLSTNRFITFIEKYSLDIHDYDNRSIALSYSSICILKHLGLWSDISNHVSKIEHIHVSNNFFYFKSVLHSRDANLPFFGIIINL